MSIARSELVPHVRRYTGFDATRPQRDETQTQGQSRAGVIEGQGEMAGAIDQGEGEDGAVFA